MLSFARLEETLASKAPFHRPVLLDQVIEALAPRPDAILVDCTLGAGGHAEGLLGRLGPQGRLYGIDRDHAALQVATRRLIQDIDRFVPLHGRLEELPELIRGAGTFAVDGIVADLGVSSMQLDDPERGFSFREDGPLDMRMDPSEGRTAADLIATVPEIELRRILHVYGEERLAGPIARAIVQRRAERPFTRTGDLAELVAATLGPRARKYRIHPATRTFQAIRIAVNDEIDGLERFVSDAVSLLRKGGRLAVIAFHSLEDRAIKHAMRGLAHRCTCPPRLPLCACGRENIVRLLTSKPIRPSDDEIANNPRARSARLRVVERI
jgi:16S rRNA (cytosine1402-N4)-methyltransferase